MSTKVTSKAFRLLDGRPLAVSSAVNGPDTAAVGGVDSDHATSKHAFVHTLVINSQEVDLLIRVEQTLGGCWIDVVGASSVANLSTAVAAMDLSSLGTGHPSPTKDAIDKQALVAAGGS